MPGHELNAAEAHPTVEALDVILQPFLLVRTRSTKLLRVQCLFSLPRLSIRARPKPVTTAQNDGPARSSDDLVVVRYSPIGEAEREALVWVECRRFLLALRTVNRMRVVFATGPSRFRARFHRDSSRDECEVVDRYFRAEPIAATAAVACVIFGAAFIP